MIKKEWLEVGKQSLYFILAMAGMVLLTGLLNWLQGKPLFQAETVIIILGFWLLMFSMFIGLSPFALDSNQKGMEYLLTLPYSRRRLLFIKFLPRLATAILFYLAFAFLYSLIGSDAFAGGFAFFSLAYFALFLISFSLSLVHENFIVQSIWAGIAFCGYLALCLFIVTMGFMWKFGMPSTWVGARIWNELAYDVPTLLAAIVVFLLMAVPFIVSIFLAFKKFDLKPSRVFNRRQLLFFAPLLFLAFAASLGITYLMQRSSADIISEYIILKNRQLLKTSFPGKLDLYSEDGRRHIKVKGIVSWRRLLHEAEEKLFLSGYDSKDGTRFIGSLNRADLSWKVLHSFPDQYFATPNFWDFFYDGMYFVYLKRSLAEVERQGLDSDPLVRSDDLELVSLDPAGGMSRVIAYKSPLFRKYYQPRLIGSDRQHGLRFWLVAQKWGHVLRLWEDGRVEDLGLSKGWPIYASSLLFFHGDNSLQVRKLLDSGSATIKKIAGSFNLVRNIHSPLVNNKIGEIYAISGKGRNKRNVCLNLATLSVADVGPDSGFIRLVAPGDFYFVEYRSWPLVSSKPAENWRKVYRLRDGQMIFLKRFDSKKPGLIYGGYVDVQEHGIIFYDQDKPRVFTFPDLQELKFTKLN